MKPHVDLDDFLGRLRGVAADAPSTPAPPLPALEDAPARVPSEVTYRSISMQGPPANVGAWLDGIQSQVTLCHVGWRPILAQYAAAMAMGPATGIVASRDDLRIVCSTVDAEWLEELIDPSWITCVPDGDEASIRAAAAPLLDASRRRLERELSARVVELVDGLVVDGPLTGHPRSTLGGVVKTHQVAYLSPEYHHDLQVGQITDPPFEILDPTSGEPTGRFSVYLRAHGHRRSSAATG